MAWIAGLFCTGSIAFFAWVLCRSAALRETPLVCRYCGRPDSNTKTGGCPHCS